MRLTDGRLSEWRGCPRKTRPLRQKVTRPRPRWLPPGWREVPIGESWAFREHRALAEVDFVLSAATVEPEPAPTPLPRLAHAPFSPPPAEKAPAVPATIDRKRQEELDAIAAFEAQRTITKGAPGFAAPSEHAAVDDVEARKRLAAMPIANTVKRLGESRAEWFRRVGKERLSGKAGEMTGETSAVAEATIAARQATHGDWAVTAEIATRLKGVIAEEWLARARRGQSDPTAGQIEALDSICTKIARILSGNPAYADHWRDIHGYLRLVEAPKTAVVAEAPEKLSGGFLGPAAFRALDKGYTGDSCPDCGSFAMVRSGTCQRCNDCGSTTGCS